MRNRSIHAEQRPLEEPFKGEAQLRHPSIKNKYREIFEEEIVKSNGNFELAIKHPLNKYQRDMRIKDMLTLPIKVLRKMKKIIAG